MDDLNISRKRIYRVSLSIQVWADMHLFSQIQQSDYAIRLAR